MALSNVRKASLGPLELVHGNYAHAVADASESIAVDGEVVALIVNPQSAANVAHDVNPNLYSVSVSGAINTVSFLQNAPVSSGTFCLLVRKGI